MKQSSWSETSVVSLVPGPISTRAAEEVVILEPKSGLYYSLDSVGAHIWSLLQEPRQIKAIRDAVVAEYDVTAADFESDLLNLLQSLKASGLIEIKDKPS